MLLVSYNNVHSKRTETVARNSNLAQSPNTYAASRAKIMHGTGCFVVSISNGDFVTHRTKMNRKGALEVTGCGTVLQCTGPRGSYIGL